MTLALNSPCDMHLHLRDGAMLENVAPLSSAQFAAAVIMPNLLPPVCTTGEALDYGARIRAVCGESFLPLVSLFFSPKLKDEIAAAKQNGIRLTKLYPQGVTTNSAKGVSAILCEENLQIFEMLQEAGMILCIHSETNGFVLEREHDFLPILSEIARNFPRLIIIMEHISDARSLELIESFPNTFGTITLHHLLFTLDDLLGGALKPHLFCKPCVKLPRDMQALRDVAFSGNPKFCFGSDSAPHLRTHKECAQCGAGVFSAPVALPALAELFENHNALQSLSAFVCENAPRIYGFTPPQKLVRLRKARFDVASDYGGVVSLFAGESLSWILCDGH
ncbi:MAG: dihydroorotase [Helicobacter sp.]|nr:dihydroorotase [Helicobacter sp.]